MNTGMADEAAMSARDRVANFLAGIAMLLCLYPPSAVAFMVFRESLVGLAEPARIGAYVYLAVTPVSCALAMWLGEPRRTRRLALIALAFWALVISFVVFQLATR